MKDSIVGLDRNMEAVTDALKSLGTNSDNLSMLLQSVSAAMPTIRSSLEASGKAIAVVMMVFQIAGAGGIYPIQTSPKIFGLLEPLRPFSYAIEYFREAIAGPIWSSVLYNVRAMCVFIGVFLLLAILKQPFHKINTTLERIYKQAKI
jgi:putative membrane protein